jgi:hypothetical protein
MKFNAESHGDYLNFRCTACGSPIRVDFLGFDPAVPRFRFKCKGCGEGGEYKMEWQLWGGLPNTRE